MLRCYSQYYVLFCYFAAALYIRTPKIIDDASLLMVFCLIKHEI